MTLQNTKNLSLNHYFKSEPNRDKLNKELEANSKDNGYDFFVSAMRFYVKAGIALYFGFLLTPRNSIQGLIKLIGVVSLIVFTLFLSFTAISIKNEEYVWSLFFPGEFSFLKKQFEYLLSFPDTISYIVGGTILIIFMFSSIFGRR